MIKSRTLVKRLLPYLKHHRLPLIASAACAVSSVALSLLAPLLIGRGVDCLIAGNVDFAALLRVIWLLAPLYALSAAAQWALSYLTVRVSARVVKDLRTQAYERLTRAPLRLLDMARQGDLTARVSVDAEAVGDGLTQALSQLLTGVAAIVGTMLFLFSISVWVALSVLIVTPLSVLVAKRVTARSHHLFIEQSDTQGELSARASESFQNHALLSVCGREDAAVEAFDKVNETLRAVGFRAQLFAALVNPLTRFVNHLVYIIVGAVGGCLAITGGGMTVGALSACLSYANQYTKPFNEVSAVTAQLQTAMAALERVFTLMDMPIEPTDAPDAVTPTRSRGEVTFSDVTFGYTRAKRLMENLSFKASPGQKIAIVGPTGAGKTTLINLLERFYDIDCGDILIDGVSIYHMTREGLRAQFGMVLQESFLIDGTVRDNIAYGKPDATDEEVISAAKRARAHSFIARLPKGYDTHVRADELSRGQKQLICIARAMLPDAPMLILDEATSAVDTRTELLVNNALDDMMRGRTSFVVAHRLSTILQADCILVMRDGRIVEMGAHEELLARGGFYKTLYDSRVGGGEAV